MGIYPDSVPWATTGEERVLRAGGHSGSPSDTMLCSTAYRCGPAPDFDRTSPTVHASSVVDGKSFRVARPVSIRWWVACATPDVTGPTVTLRNVATVRRA
ncbi:hypothetical protein GCM10009779_41560 [Polymorphospora rubra]|uniref:Uncharacterized protein n=1 Tax=Polymorphospora rubra TaxID=338584 RepID=A0A810MU29_9ACTN|nr:hypothetical protein Prubr_17180 [Polymorphospora rubra]